MEATAATHLKAGLKILSQDSELTTENLIEKLNAVIKDTWMPIHMRSKNMVVKTL